MFESSVELVGLPLMITLLVTASSAQQADPLAELMAAITSGRVAVVDLTYNSDERTPYWPEHRTETPFRAKVAATYKPDGLFARDLEIPEHFGTHIDAPAHFKPGGWDVSEIPTARLIAPAVVIDVTPAAETDDEYRVSVEDINRWEKSHGTLPRGGIVLLRTGWGRHWPSQRAFMKQDTEGRLHFPCLTVEAGRYLMAQMKPVGIGIDSPGIDLGADHTYPLHHMTLDSGTYLLENVGQLETLPATGAILIVSPMKLTRGSGSPVRILALFSRPQKSPSR